MLIVLIKAGILAVRGATAAGVEVRKVLKDGVGKAIVAVLEHAALVGATDLGFRDIDSSVGVALASEGGCGQYRSNSGDSNVGEMHFDDFDVDFDER